MCPLGSGSYECSPPPPSSSRVVRANSVVPVAMAVDPARHRRRRRRSIDCQPHARIRSLSTRSHRGSGGGGGGVSKPGIAEPSPLVRFPLTYFRALPSTHASYVTRACTSPHTSETVYVHHRPGYKKKKKV